MNVENKNIEKEIFEPYYVAIKNEKVLFKAAFKRVLSVVLKALTGSGKPGL